MVGTFSATTIPIKLGTGKWFWEFRVSADGGGMGVAKTNGAGGALVHINRLLLLVLEQTQQITIMVKQTL